MDELDCVVASAVESAVDQPLHALSERSEADRDEQRGGGRDPRRPASEQDAADQRRARVHRAEDDRQRRVDERAVDQPLDRI